MRFEICLSGTVVVQLQLSDVRLGQQILGMLGTINYKEDLVMATLADIQAKVAAETTVEASVVTLLQTLSADLKVAIASNDPVALQAISDQLDTNTATLSAAVMANTPAATPASTVGGAAAP